MKAKMDVSIGDFVNVEHVRYRGNMHTTWWRPATVTWVDDTSISVMYADDSTNESFPRHSPFWQLKDGDAS